MPNSSQMLEALHKADPKTLKKRYTPQQLQAAFTQLQAGKKAGAPATPAAPAAPTGSEMVSTAELVDPKRKLNSAADIINTQGDVSRQIATENDLLNNPNQVGATGDTRYYEKDAQGRTVVKDTLSDPNKRILDAGQNLSGETLDRAFNSLNGSQLGTAFNPQVGQRTLGNNWSADRQGVTDAVFSNLTRGVDDSYKRDMDAKAQELANRGIPVGSKAYNDQMKQMNMRYDDMKTNARNQAIQSSGDEFTRQFGQQEQMIANQYSQASGVRNQQMGELQGLSQVGPGMVTSQFQGQTPIDIQTPDVAGITTQLKSLGLDAKQINAAIQNMKRPSGGGQQQPQQPAFSSPFNTSGPPI